jgi:glycosyltransferase involved in cell wall biosynthesis
LLNVSNPRPQKALERLPAVLRALGEGARLALVGDQLGRTLPAREALGALERALESEGVTARVRRVDATEDVGAWLLAADVLVTPSAWEGLSLAWLEARALELPVVCTAVGGAEEVARGDPGVHLVPPEAPAEVFAQAVRAALEGGRSASPRREHFTVDAMARRYLSLYRRAADPVERGDTVWLVTNNFSVGGAQSSARRLLTGLAARGVAVRAATLQERPSRPTRGRLALAADGVPVLALAPPEEAGAEAAVEEFLGALREHPPRAVLLWNALAEHKVRIADALTAIPVFDVSPGEMYHQSLLRFFGHSRLPPGLPYTRPEDYGRLLRAVVVKHHAERAEAEALGAPVVVIPNGVPLPAAPPPPREATGVVLGTSARISAQKRLDLLLDAFERAARRVPGLSLRIAGGVERGQEAHAAELRARAGGLPVTFLGDVADIDGFLSGLDVFVMVSEPAGCPNASLEAMAQGLPLVVTDAGGAREQVVHGENGLVTGRHDPEALAEAIATLARAPALRERYGAASRDRLRARFSLPRMVNDYLALLSSEGPPGPRPEGGLTTPGP